MRALRFLLYFVLGVAFFGGLSLCCLNTAMPWITHKGQTVQVPDLVGVDMEQAKQELEELGLELRTDTALASKKYPKGAITAQRPRPGAVVRPGRRVVVTVSLGEKRVVIPDLEAEEMEHAKATLKKMGLQVQVVDKTSTDTEAGLVIGTKPGPGAEAAVGDTVILVVSAGLPVIVPDTVLQELEHLSGDSALPDTTLPHR